MEALRQAISTIIPFSEEDWQAFSSCFRSATLAKNQPFAVEGRTETNMGFLLSGVARAFYRTDEGIEYNKTFFVSGDFFGAYASLVRKRPNRIHIQALTDLEYYAASYRDLVKLFPEHRKIETLARLIAEEFYIEKENREIELALLQADERYALFRERYPGVENTIPQYHIASYLGITPTQLSRIRSKRPRISLHR